MKHKIWVRCKILFIWSFCLLLASPVAADNANSPWQLLNGGFDSTIRGAWLLALPDLPADPGNHVFKLFQDSALFMGSDGGGVSRSVLPDGENANDFGKNWEMVNGGRGVSDSVCGGYGELASATMCGVNADPSARTPLIYGGPPSALESYDVVTMASGGWPKSLVDGISGDLAVIAGLSLAPDNSAARATGVVYRISGPLSVSPDAGRQWFPLAPQCSLNATITYRAVVADAGKPGHVVVASRANGNGIHDAGGCPLADANNCRVRQIAWTNDVGPQIYKSVQSTAGAATPNDIDFAGHGVGVNYDQGWRFSTISHLVRRNIQAVKDGADCTYDPSTRLAHDDQCTGQFGKSVCHGWKVEQLDNKAEQSCPDQDGLQICNCTPIGFDGNNMKPLETAHCDTPLIDDLSIDPRNGFVYANTQAGLLVSPDGGRIWERFGAGSFSKWTPAGFTGIFSSVEVKSPLAAANANPVDRGAKLLTRQGLVTPSAEQCQNTPGLCDGEVGTFDLNAQPEYIESISAIGQSWQACPGGANAPKYANGRTRGELVATVAVTWHNPMKVDQILSGVFVAAQIDNCTASENPLPPPGALVFRDTANLTPVNNGCLFQAMLLGVPGNDNYSWHWDTEPLMNSDDPPQPFLKLPRFMSHPDSGLPAGDRCRMTYLAAAAAPNDSRVLYTWAHASYPEGGYSPFCQSSSGLWRSLDRGLSWQPNLVQADSQAQNNAGAVDAPILTVSPHSPYVVVVGHKGTWNFAELYLPATGGKVIAAPGQPTVQTSLACPPAPNGNPDKCSVVAAPDFLTSKTQYCDKSFALADQCASMGAPASQTLNCNYHAADGAAKCDGNPYHLSHCAVVPAWNQPVIASLQADSPPVVTVAYNAAKLGCGVCATLQQPLIADFWLSTLAMLPYTELPCCTLQSNLATRDWRDWTPDTLQCLSNDGKNYLGQKFSASRHHSGGSALTIARLHTADGTGRFLLGNDDQTSGVTVSGVKLGNGEEFLTFDYPPNLSCLDAPPATCVVRAFESIAVDPDPTKPNSAWALVNNEGVALGKDPPAQMPLPQAGTFLRLAHLTNLAAKGGVGALNQPKLDTYPELFDWRQLWNGDDTPPTANPTVAELNKLVFQPGAVRIGQNGGVVRDFATPRLIFGQGNVGKPMLFAAFAGAGLSRLT